MDTNCSIDTRDETLRTRKYLTTAEIERLMAAARKSFPVVSIQNNAALSQGPADGSRASWRCVKAPARAVAFSYYD